LHVPVVEQLAEVGHSSAVAPDQCPAFIQSPAVCVRDRDACDVGLGLKVEHVTLADQSEPNEANTDAIVCP
jgi:hypothetical protein